MRRGEIDSIMFKGFARFSSCLSLSVEQRIQVIRFLTAGRTRILNTPFFGLLIAMGCFGRFAVLRLELNHMLIDWQVILAKWVEPDKSVTLSYHVERLPHRFGKKSDLICPHSRYYSPIFNYAFCANDDHIRHTHGICNRRFWNSSYRYTLRSECKHSTHSFCIRAWLRSTVVMNSRHHVDYSE